MLEYNICKWSFIASKYVLCIYYHVSIIITYTYIIRSWIKLKQLGTKLGQCRTMLVNTWLHQGVSLQAPKSHGFFFALLTPSTWQGRLLKADVLHLLGNTSQLEKKYEKVQFGDILDLHNIIHQVKLEFVVAVGFGGIRTAFDFCTWGVAKMVWGICELIILKYWHTGYFGISTRMASCFQAWRSQTMLPIGRTKRVTFTIWECLRERERDVFDAKEPVLAGSFWFILYTEAPCNHETLSRGDHLW